MADYKEIYVDLSNYFEDQKKNRSYNKYKEEINNIYNKYKNSENGSNLAKASFDKLLFDKLFIRFYEFCDQYCDKYIENWKDAYIKKGKGDDAKTLSLVHIVLDKVKVAIETYKDDIGDFFSYTLMLIERDINSKTKDEHPFPINKTDYKSFMQAAKKLEIDVFGHKNKIKFEDIQMLSQETEFSIDKIKDILQKISVNTIYSTDYPMQNDEEDENTFGNTIEDDKSKLNIYELSKVKNQLSLIDELYNYYRYREKKQDRYISKLKLILANYIIKRIIQSTDKNETDKYTTEKAASNEYFDKEGIVCLIKTFKFYDETDVNIKQLMDDFCATGKYKKQEELAQILRANGEKANGESYINRFFKEEIEDVLNKAIELSNISMKTNKEIIEEVAKKQPKRTLKK